ncbi:MAG: LCP family protein [Patescibacteria group bacterium]|nr:LCP family protein [Patescibacteria group bacterium]
MLNHNSEKNKNWKDKIVPTFLIIFLLIASLISYKFFSIGKTIFKITAANTSLLGQLQKFAIPNKKLKGEKEKRTNILLLGVGGEGHDGAMLTDTIIIFSIKYEDDKPRVALISIPRDLYVDLKNFGNTKINSIYALDKDSSPDSNRIIKSIEDITGLPIHYYVQADFEGFKKAVDAIGGINVNVEHSFIDEEYPTDDFGYETISFEKGLNHMNGETALKYSRSRHGIVTDGSEAYEANDSARAKRQQQILYASKEKAMSLWTISNPKKINDLLGILGEHIRTNLELWEMLKLGELAKNIDSSDLKNHVLDDSPNGLLYASTSPDGAFIFLPKTNNFTEIHHYCKNVFEPKQEDIETANIKVLNGTEIPNQAQEAAAMIAYDNIKILALDNASKIDYNKTIVYDYSNGKKPNTIEFLKNRFDAKVIKSTTIPKEYIDNNNQIDIIMIIGKNFSQLPRYEY